MSAINAAIFYCSIYCSIYFILFYMCGRSYLSKYRKVIFQQYYSYILHIIYVISEETNCNTVVLQRICLLTVVYCFLLYA